MPLPEAKARVRRLFNRIAIPYARRVRSQFSAEARGDVAWLRPRGHERALDVACGPGTLGLELAPCTSRVYGLDLAERMILQARRAARARHRPNIHFGVADGERLPFPANCFDLVTCSYSFANFLAPQRVVAEMLRVTRPGGRIAVLEVLAPEDAVRRRRLNRLEQMRSGLPTRLLSLTDLVALFAGANLHLLDCHIQQRQRRLDDWLALSRYGHDPRSRRRLRQAVLGTAKASDTGLHFCRKGSRWVFYHTVARLLWRK